MDGRIQDVKRTEYGGIVTASVFGAVLSDRFYLTHFHEWTIQECGRVAVPWSCVNNCTQIEKSISNGEEISVSDLVNFIPLRLQVECR